MRHLTVELRKDLIANVELSSNTIIALLVMIPRENVRSVCGFQIGKIIFTSQICIFSYLMLFIHYIIGNWSCYHLDEVETSENDMSGSCVELVSSSSKPEGRERMMDMIRDLLFNI